MNRRTDKQAALQVDARWKNYFMNIRQGSPLACTLQYANRGGCSSWAAAAAAAGLSVGKHLGVARYVDQSVVRQVVIVTCGIDWRPSAGGRWDRTLPVDGRVPGLPIVERLFVLCGVQRAVWHLSIAAGYVLLLLESPFTAVGHIAAGVLYICAV